MFWVFFLISCTRDPFTLSPFYSLILLDFSAICLVYFHMHSVHWQSSNKFFCSFFRNVFFFFNSNSCQHINSLLKPSISISWTTNADKPISLHESAIWIPWPQLCSHSQHNYFIQASKSINTPVEINLSMFCPLVDEFLHWTKKTVLQGKTQSGYWYQLKVSFLNYFFPWLKIIRPIRRH